MLTWYSLEPDFAKKPPRFQLKHVNISRANLTLFRFDALPHVTTLLYDAALDLCECRLLKFSSDTVAACSTEILVLYSVATVLFSKYC